MGKRSFEVANMIRIILYFLTSSLFCSLAYAQTANIGIADYGSYTNSNRTFIANHADAVVSGTGTIDIAGLKNIHPAMKVFGYWNALFRYESDTLGLTENMYFHDPATGAKIQKDAPGTVFDGMWMMDPSSTAWRQYSIEAIKNSLKVGFDGIHLDEAIGNLTNPIWRFRNYTAVPAWYDTTAWNSAVQEYVDAIKTAISPGLVIFNGLNELPEFLEANYLAVCDGAVMEGFVYNTLWAGTPPSESEWVARMDAYLSVPEHKLVTCVAQGSKHDVDGRMFSFTSYLLGVNANRLFYYNFASHYDTLSYFPEWQIDLGAPLDTFASVSGYFNAADRIYERNFSGGKVLVNPSESRQHTVSFRGTPYRVMPAGGLVAELGGTGTISFAAVNSVTLGPRQGAVLLKNPTVGIAPNESQTPKQFLLSPNYPNPFNPNTTIRYRIADRAYVELAIYDIRGEAVAMLVQENQAAGRYAVQWNGLTRQGEAAGSGVYVIRLRAGGFAESQKILLVK